MARRAPPACVLLCDVPYVHVVANPGVSLRKVSVQAANPTARAARDCFANDDVEVDVADIRSSLRKCGCTMQVDGDEIFSDDFAQAFKEGGTQIANLP